MRTGDSKSRQIEVVALSVALAIVGILLIIQIGRVIAPADDPLPVTRPSPAPTVATAAKAEDGAATWITQDDYPAESIRAEEEGTVRFRAVINTRGRVRECEIVESSGHPRLDQAACDAIKRRARFDPARDADGRAIPSTFSRRVVWKLPDETPYPPPASPDP